MNDWPSATTTRGASVHRRGWATVEVAQGLFQLPAAIEDRVAPSEFVQHAELFVAQVVRVL